MNKHERISIDTQVMVGKPVIKGTRITVEQIMYKLDGASTEDDLLEAYPHLTREDIRAAVAYAANTSPERLPAPDRTFARMVRRRRMPRV